MIRLVGCTQAGELVGMLHPREVAAVHHTSAHLSGQTVHIFRGGVGDDVSAPFKRAAVDGCGEGVVHDEGHTILVGDFGKFLDVEHGTTWVRDGLTEECLRVRAEGSLYLFLAGVL